MTRLLTRWSPLCLSLHALLALLGGPLAAQPPEPPPPCTEVPGFAKLDFWVGSWNVYLGERKVGTNRIEKILDGCAVMEHWSAAGGEGKSLFYYLPHDDDWKQVWVTGRATGLGGVKEKTLVEELPGGGLRFQGRLPRPGGQGTFLDRTTLTPLPEGRVRQVIETSEDEGETWQLRWDSVYVPAGAPAPTPPTPIEPDGSDPGATQPGTSSHTDDSSGS